MKKIYSFILVIFLIQSKTFSQTVILQTDFSGYNGTQATTPAGWNISWHSSGSTTSFYSTASFSGLTPPSYKFGQDSVMVFTPAFSNADTLKFWCKGSGISVQSKLNIYESPDSSNWTMLASIDSLPTTGKIFRLGISSSSKYLYFVYRKISGNLAFDDVQIIASSSVAAPENNVFSQVKIYPSLSSYGQFTIHSSKFKVQSFKVYNIIGECVQEQTWNTEQETLNCDLQSQPNGIFFVKIATNSGNVTKKIIIAK